LIRLSAGEMLSGATRRLSEAFRRVALTANLPSQNLYPHSSSHVREAGFNASAVGAADGRRFLPDMEFVSKVKVHAIR
jgi:hypothetical protein